MKKGKNTNIQNYRCYCIDGFKPIDESIPNNKYSIIMKNNHCK